ncbi:kelch repeat-containing protein [Hyalangium minutum]|uniref:High-affinity leucine-specific transport system, periplasmic binding protein LivK n=1 Tax=Hyalangium minutum TaxID=394096 RepID=A0A085W2L6_9BACT|nr:kelch repeat-containing protein [Hyalangium minutum]KFE61929.1 High-affinity leucine-specific transport system, periplasmic binding protein LivK [Hyalangium minutum]
MTKRLERSAPALPQGATCLLLGCLALGCGPSSSSELPWMKELLQGESSTVETSGWRDIAAMDSIRTSHTATLLPNGKVLILGGSNATAKALVSAEFYDLSTGEWEKAGTLETPRAGHTATLLLNGKVLVAGGRNDNDQALDTFEVYDPATKISTQPTLLMDSARYDHTATLLASGKVLVTGGLSDSTGRSSLDTAEVYDPDQGSWQAADTMSHARSRHTATRLPSDRVLIAGGTDSELTSDAEEYAPDGSAAIPVGKLIQNRSEHTATLLPSGKVLIAGGKDLNGRSIGTAELYDPNLRQWRPCKEMMQQARIGHTAVLLFTGKVLVAGGYVSPTSPTGIPNTEEYDPDEETWSDSGTSLGTGRLKHTATLLPDGRVLVTGGFGTSAVQSAEVYGSGMGNWRDGEALLQERSGHTVTQLPGGKLLIVGGTSNGTTALKSAELYDPASGKWSPTAKPLGTARFHHTATLLPNGKVLVTGGTSSGTSALKSAELYDPATGNWSPTAKLLETARFHHTATLLPTGQVLVAGGTSGQDTALKDAELYDPASNTWIPAENLSSPRFLHTATPLPSGEVLLIGGTQGLNSPVDSDELYDPKTGTWSSIPSSRASRFEHTATLLPSGLVMVAGGRSGAHAVSSVEFYDPKESAWVETASVTLNTGRYGHTATLLLSGLVLIAGGTNGLTVFASSEVYDPALGVWSPLTPSQLTARHHSTATLLPSGKVLVAGGVNDSGRLKSFQIYEGPVAAKSETSRPSLHSIPPKQPGSTLELQGTHLINHSETSGGNARSSSSALPLVSLVAVDGGALTRVTQWATFSDSLLTFTLPKLQTGHYILSVTAQGASGGRVLLVDGTPPAAPQVARPLQDQAIHTTSPPDMTGAAEPGSTVALTLDGVKAGSMDIDAKGNWSYTPPAPLGLGAHTLSVTATDPAGNSSEASSVTFHIERPVSHYGWGCASTPGLSLSGLWLGVTLWLRQRSKRQSAFPLGH